jgi:protein-disulfide isomerase
MAASGSSKSSKGSSSSKSSKSATSTQERREAQREALRKQRQAELARQKRIRTLVIAAITVVALVIVAGIGTLIYRSMQPDGPVAVPAGMSEDQPYLSLGAPEGSGAPVLEIHLDFMCPHCGTFEEINGEDISTMVDGQEATVNLVPRRFMDAQSTSGDFSTRAANAMVCVFEDDPANVTDFQQLVFANQPDGTGSDPTNEELIDFAQEVGASAEIESCVTGGTYRDWVRDVSEPYGAEEGGSTPYISLDGTEIPIEQANTPGVLRQTVLEAGGSTASDAGGAEASDGGEG